MRRYTVTAVTIADGSVTAFSPRARGKVHSISYVKHGVTPYTDGVDFTITSEDTGQTIWTEANVNAAKTVLPRAGVASTAGVAGLYAAAGEAVQDAVALVGRVKIVIAAGGDTKTGTFIILVD